jgi:molecular chaperone GrpE
VDADQDRETRVRVVDRRWWARGDAETAEETAVRKPTYVEELEQRIAALTEQLQKLTAEHRRALDDFDQARARLRRELSRDVERGKRAVIAELLEVVDNLDRAIAAGQDARGPEAMRPPGPGPAADAERLARGVELVRDQFLAKLQAFGVVRVPALGERFDAQQHEAVTTTPVDDESRHGCVVAVIKEGYRIGDDVLRPAAVVVGQKDGPQE